MKSRTLILGICLAFCGSAAFSQNGSTTLTKAMKDEAIAGLSKTLLDNYVFPDVAKKMEAAFKERQRKGEYDSVTDGAAFAKLLTEHAQAVSKDNHLRDQFHKNKVQMPTPSAGPTPQDMLDFEKELKRINGGFEKVERLQGNVGYLDFRFFGQHPIAFKAVDSAFAFLQHTDALII